MQNAQEIEGRWDTLRGKVKEKWGQLTDDDLKMVGGNIDQVLGRIQQKTGAARADIEKYLNDVLDTPAANRAKEAIAGFAHGANERMRDAGDHLRESYGNARERAQDGYRQAGQMFESHPAESMVAVFGLGIVTGVVLGLMLRE
jgi:uncharacterized protein YjbJ (UPF0337 family)